VSEIHEVYEREVRDLACFEFRTTVTIELYRIRCPECGIKTERVEQLPSKAPFSKRFEEMVGQACESASAWQVARRFSLAESTVRVMDLRYLERWTARRLMERPEVLRANIGQGVLLPVGPDVLDRIELRGITRQVFDAQPWAILMNEAARDLALVRRQPIPYDRQRSWDVAQQRPQKLHDLGTFDAAPHGVKACR
jgi:hypothetical protein